MSFLDTIEQLQKKPRPARVRFLIVSVGAVMAIIIFVWVTNLSAIFHPDTQTFDDSIRPFTVLGDILRDSFQNAKKQLSAIPL